MLSASSLRAASSKMRRGLVFDSLRRESETLRYSVALRMAVSMVLAPFERLEGWKEKRADTGCRYPLHGGGLATNRLVRERFEKALHPKIAVPLQGELLMLAVKVEQGDVVAAHNEEA